METDFIKKIIEELLEKIPVRAELREVLNAPDGEIVKFRVYAEDAHALIGLEGKTLLALNHLIKKIVEKQTPDGAARKLSFIVDVNDYQEKKIQELKNRAQIMAERARFFKSNIECPPMNPYERMIIHSFFTGVPDIKTESTGMGMERRVVIKYVNQNQELGASL